MHIYTYVYMYTYLETFIQSDPDIFFNSKINPLPSPFINAP